MTWWDDFTQGAKNVANDFFANLQKESVNQGAIVEQNPNSAGPEYGTFLDQEIARWKDKLTNAAATTFRGTKTGQDFIAEVKNQEIQDTIKTYAPVIGVGVLVYKLLF